MALNLLIDVGRITIDVNVTSVGKGGSDVRIALYHGQGG